MSVRRLVLEWLTPTILLACAIWFAGCIYRPVINVFPGVKTDVRWPASQPGAKRECERYAAMAKLTGNPLGLYRIEPGGRTRTPVATVAEAQCAVFECPKCGEHSILVWFANRDVPEDEMPSPRWNASGTTIADLTLSPSIQLMTGCKWHGNVNNGETVNQ